MTHGYAAIGLHAVAALRSFICVILVFILIVLVCVVCLLSFSPGFENEVKLCLSRIGMKIILDRRYFLNLVYKLPTFLQSRRLSVLLTNYTFKVHDWKPALFTVTDPLEF